MRPSKLHEQARQLNPDHFFTISIPNPYRTGFGRLQLHERCRPTGLRPRQGLGEQSQLDPRGLSARRFSLRSSLPGLRSSLPSAAAPQRALRPPVIAAGRWSQCADTGPKGAAPLIPSPRTWISRLRSSATAPSWAWPVVLMPETSGQGHDSIQGGSHRPSTQRRRQNRVTPRRYNVAARACGREWSASHHEARTRAGRHTVRLLRGQSSATPAEPSTVIATPSVMR